MLRHFLRSLGYLLALVFLGALLTALQVWYGLDSGSMSLDLVGAQKPVAVSAGEISRLWNDLGRLRFLAAENKALMQRNRMLAAEAERLQAVEKENERLRSLLKLRRGGMTEGIAASVIARDPELWFSQITVDKGRMDGVTEDMIAVSTSGLIGKVTAVGASSCRIRLLFDRNSVVPAKLSRSGAVGVIYGNDDISCTMKYIRHDSAISEGDIVVTSGLGDIYPGGITIGRAGRQYGRTDAMFQTLQIIPTADFSQLSEVLLVRKKKAGRS